MYVSSFKMWFSGVKCSLLCFKCDDFNDAILLDYSVNNSYDRSGSNTPNIVNQQKQAPPKNQPMFITVSYSLFHQNLSRNLFK